MALVSITAHNVGDMTQGAHGHRASASAAVHVYKKERDKMITYQNDSQTVHPVSTELFSQSTNDKVEKKYIWRKKK